MISLHSLPYGIQTSNSWRYNIVAREGAMMDKAEIDAKFSSAHLRDNIISIVKAIGHENRPLCACCFDYCGRAAKS